MAFGISLLKVLFSTELILNSSRFKSTLVIGGFSFRTSNPPRAANLFQPYPRWKSSRRVTFSSPFVGRKEVKLRVRKKVRLQKFGTFFLSAMSDAFPGSNPPEFVSSVRKKSFHPSRLRKGFQTPAVIDAKLHPPQRMFFENSSQKYVIPRENEKIELLRKKAMHGFSFRWGKEEWLVVFRPPRMDPIAVWVALLSSGDPLLGFITRSPFPRLWWRVGVVGGGYKSHWQTRAETPVLGARGLERLGRQTPNWTKQKGIYLFI